MENDFLHSAMIRQFLESQLEIKEFKKVSEAVSYVERNTVDVALINDYLTGNVDGVSILSQLKRSSKSQFRAIAVMEYISAPQRKYLLESGFEKVISKPISRDEFVGLIDFFK